jgi:uncharacterized repeat protein (TIGR02543 family)
MIRTPRFTRPVLTGTLLLAGLTGLLAAQTSRGGQAPGYGELTVAANLHRDVSQPLRQIPASPSSAPIQRAQHPIPAMARPTPDSNSVQSTANMVNGGTGAATTLGIFNILGVGNYFSGPDGSFVPATTPSDATGAVGTTQYLQWVDDSFAVFSKATGNVVYGPVPGNTLWSGFGGPCETHNDGQPTVNFDKLADRWVVSQHALPSGSTAEQCVAVSTTDDATGTWYRYSFSMATPNNPWTNADAKLGVWPDGYYMSFDMYAGSTFEGPLLCALQRNMMLLGEAARSQCILLGTQEYSPVVSDVDSATPPPVGAPAYFATDDIIYFATDLFKFHVNWTDSQNTTISLPILLEQSYYSTSCMGYATACVVEPNGSHLDPFGNHLTGRMPYRNFGSYGSLLAAETVESLPTIRFYEFRVASNGDLSVYQQGDLDIDMNSYRFIPSMAEDRAGNIAAAYNVSNATLWPSQYVASRAPGDAPGTLGNETLLNPGNGSQTTSEWDTRASLTVDPVDDCTFYYTQQYQPMDGTNNWVTQIEDFTLAGCYVPLAVQTTPVDLKISATGIGISASQLAPLSAQAPEGSTVTLGATSPQPGGTGTRYVFANWSDGGAQRHSIALPSAGATYTANFTTQYQLSRVVNPAGSGTVTPAVATWYNSGTAAAITATPAAGYSFTGWTGSVANPTAASTTITMNAPQVVKATFTPLLTTVNVVLKTKSGPANARVWDFNFANAGPGQANNIKINRFSLTQTAGTACKPVLISTIPLVIGSLAPSYMMDGYVSIDFSSCASNAVFSLIMTVMENAGASSTSVNLTKQSQ